MQVKAIYQQGHPAVGLSQFGDGVEMRRYILCLGGSPDWLGHKKSHTIKTVLMMIMKTWQLFVIEHLDMSDIEAGSRLCKLSPILRLTLQCQYYYFHYIDRNLGPKKPVALPEAVQVGLERNLKRGLSCSKPWLIFQLCHIDPWNRKIIQGNVCNPGRKWNAACTLYDGRMEGRPGEESWGLEGAWEISLRKQELTCTWRKEIRILEKEKKEMRLEMPVLY